MSSLPSSLQNADYDIKISLLASFKPPKNNKNSKSEIVAPWQKNLECTKSVRSCDIDVTCFVVMLFFEIKEKGIQRRIYSIIFIFDLRMF